MMAFASFYERNTMNQTIGYLRYKCIESARKFDSTTQGQFCSLGLFLTLTLPWQLKMILETHKQCRRR
jgi:hypothetical protein